MDERIRELEKRWLDKRNKLMDGMIRISAIADRWNFEADDLREDNKKLTAERDAAKALVDLQRVALVESDMANDALNAKLEALAAQEPVAWIGDSPTKGNGRQLFWTYAGAHAYASKIEPLYTRPAVPLTRQQVISMMDDAGYSNIQERANFINGIRHAELAHGIKPISECSDGEIYSRLSARDHKPNEPELFGWMVSGVPTVMRGSLAEAIQKNEAKRIGGTCVAFPVYAHPDRIAAANRQAEATDWSAA